MLTYDQIEKFETFVYNMISGRYGSNPQLMDKQYERAEEFFSACREALSEEEEE